MNHMGCFTLDGVMDIKADFFTVSRKGDMLSLEFINNVVIPIRMRKETSGGYNCFIQAFRIFGDAVPEDARFVVHRKSMLDSNSVSVEITVLGEWADKYGVNIDAYASGKMQIHMTRETDPPFTPVNYDDVSMQRWVRETGVHRPEGCCRVDFKVGCTAGCSLDQPSGMYIIGFPNGFRFPVFVVEHGVVIAGKEIPLRYHVGDFFVNIKCVTAAFVVFSIIFSDNESMVAVRDIVYTKDYAKYGDSQVDTISLTKRIVLG